MHLAGYVYYDQIGAVIGRNRVTIAVDEAQAMSERLGILVRNMRFAEICAYHSLFAMG